MKTHIAINGAEIRHDPDAKTERFLAEVARQVENPKLKENDIIGYAYGETNPMLVHDPSGRHLVTKETLDNPSNLVLGDLLYRKRIAQSGKSLSEIVARYTLSVGDAAKELGVTEDSVRKQLRDFKLSGWKKDGEWFLDPKLLALVQKGAQRGPVAPGTGVLHCVAGKADKAFLFVKAPGRDEPAIGTKGAEDITIRKWSRIAVYTGGHGKARLFEIEHDPGARDVPPVAFHDWKVEGPIKVIRKVNNAAEARRAWEAFKAV